MGVDVILFGFAFLYFSSIFFPVCQHLESCWCLRSFLFCQLHFLFFGAFIVFMMSVVNSGLLILHQQRRDLDWICCFGFWHSRRIQVCSTLCVYCSECICCALCCYPDLLLPATHPAFPLAVQELPYASLSLVHKFLKSPSSWWRSPSWGDGVAACWVGLNNGFLTGHVAGWVGVVVWLRLTSWYQRMPKDSWAFWERIWDVYFRNGNHLKWELSASGKGLSHVEYAI